MDDVEFEDYELARRRISEEDLTGFFEGWPNRPSPASLLSILEGSYCSFVARTHSTQVIGMVSAISDGVLSAYIPLLEVVPEYRGRGIGSHLMQLVLARLDGMYMVDLTCDQDLVPFYSRFGMHASQGMSLRRPQSIPSN